MDAEGFHDGEDDGIAAGWGRMFDMRRLDDPAADLVGPALESLRQGELNDVLVKRFTDAGMKLPAGIVVDAGDAGKNFSFTANVGGVDRKFELRLRGPNLSGFKLISPAMVS